MFTTLLSFLGHLVFATSRDFTARAARAPAGPSMGATSWRPPPGGHFMETPHRGGHFRRLRWLLFFFLLSLSLFFLSFFLSHLPSLVRRFKSEVGLKV